ncbi:MAG: hypothetical protein GX154_13005, partial [Clostridiales bacterium]|nr:hypothetical protein [Clostridiales bacterium]
MDLKIKCVIDTKAYSEKPKDGALICSRMTKADTYSIADIKKKILNGYTVRPSSCGTREHQWKSQQMFMIDIDNKPVRPKNISDREYEKIFQEYLKTKYRTYNDIINQCKKINLLPAFIYTSFNHHEDHHKFRLVYILDKEITDFNTAKRIQLYLMDSIGDVDIQCKNLNRFYYAGRSIVYDGGNILSAEELIKVSESVDISSNEQRVNNNSPNTFLQKNLKSSEFNGFKNIDAIRSLNVESLKSLVNTTLQDTREKKWKEKRDINYISSIFPPKTPHDIK